jgi:hypothetical protein
MIALDSAVKNAAHGLARIVAQEMATSSIAPGEESRRALAIELALRDFAKAMLEQAAKSPTKLN